MVCELWCRGAATQAANEGDMSALDSNKELHDGKGAVDRCGAGLRPVTALGLGLCSQKSFALEAQAGLQAVR